MNKRTEYFYAYLTIFKPAKKKLFNIYIKILLFKKTCLVLMMFNVSVTHIKQVIIKYSMLEPSPTVMWKNKILVGKLA